MTRGVMAWAMTRLQHALVDSTFRTRARHRVFNLRIRLRCYASAPQAALHYRRNAIDPGKQCSALPRPLLAHHSSMPRWCDLAGDTYC